ncbi:General secretion pathway protein A, partial [hydrothermal vent metagenome]
MYNKFYGFRENPFSLLPDPDFLFVGREHGAALNLLELAVLNQSGFCVISGEIGAGKTTIVRELLNRLNDQVRVGLITNTHTSFNDLMRWVLAAFDLKMTSTDGVLMHRKFTQFVTEQFKNGKHTLLIIDEAQNLSVAALEQLRMLSNINSGSDLLLQVVLVGQRELREKLARPELEQFAQRISIDYFLKPLSETDTASYISHRVAHAGGKSSLFDQEACAQIYRHCEGVPRVINRLCDLSLVYGYAENAPAISAKLVNAVVTEHKFTKSGMGEDIADPVALKAIPVTNSKKETQESAMITASQKKQNEAVQPIEVKAQPTEVKAQPIEVKAQPIEVKKEEISVVKPAQPNEQPPKQEVSAEPREKPRKVAQVQAAK